MIDFSVSSSIVRHRDPRRDAQRDAGIGQSRDSDGGFGIRVAARSRAGNWLPTGGIERYALMLRLYDTPVGVATRTQRDAPMPSITTVGCP